MTAFIVAGFLLFPPLIWFACGVCLTGDVYYNRLKKDGAPARWSAGNKIAAVVILLVQAGALAYVVVNRR